MPRTSKRRTYKRRIRGGDFGYKDIPADMSESDVFTNLHVAPGRMNKRGTLRRRAINSVRRSLRRMGELLRSRKSTENALQREREKLHRENEELQDIRSRLNEHGNLRLNISRDATRKAKEQAWNFFRRQNGSRSVRDLKKDFHQGPVKLKWWAV